MDAVARSMDSTFPPPTAVNRSGVVPAATGVDRPGTGLRRWGAAAVLGVLWAILCGRLGAVWSVDEQYGYGWFVPVFAVVLGFLRWEDRPAPGRVTVTANGHLAAGVGVGLALGLLAPLRLFENANPDWRVLGWLHAGVLAALTLGAFGAAGGWRWVRWMAFPVAFFFVGVPWIRSVEEGVIQGLMHGVAAAAAEGLQLLGTPARVEGNLLRVGTGTLGVNEACSGVRSLQTSLMIGLLLGELHRLSVRRRVALVLGAVGLAVSANVLRALGLAVIAARHGLAAAERGHDAAGWVILGLVFAGTLGLAALLRRRGTALPMGNDVSHPARFPGRALPTAWLAGALAWTVALEAGVEGWYRWHERDLAPQMRWSVHWPADAPGFRDLPVEERTRRILHCDEGRGAAWREGGNARCLTYFFRWQPGRNSPLLASAHRPDVCLPAAGWEAAGDDGVHLFPVAPGLTLPFRQYRFTRREGGGTTHVFYCLWEDRAAPGTGDDAATAAAANLGQDPAEGTYAERWQAVREGRRHLGQRVLEVAFMDVGAGVPAVIANGRTPDLLARIVNGEKVGTRFAVKQAG